MIRWTALLAALFCAAAAAAQAIGTPAPENAESVGRRLLWDDQPERAAAYLGSYVRDHAGDCDARNDYGLALAWSDRPAAALDQYRSVIESCPALRNVARLRAAMAARWEDRPSLAARFYEDVKTEGTEEERAEADVGLAYVALLRDDTRRALDRFEGVTVGAQANAASEGAAIAAWRLGLPHEAARRISAAESRGPLSRDMADLRDAVMSADRIGVRPALSTFHDADGTSFRSGALGVSKGWRRNTRAELSAGSSELSNASRSEKATWLEAEVERRTSPAFAMRLTARRTAYAEWTPFSGEANLVWTPSDRTRIDITGAKLVISDNLAAMEHRLAGDFVSIGTDRRLTDRGTLVAAVDSTSWSAGNRRTRVFLNWRQRFEGVPRVTVEWPSMVQLYDEPFSFALFSPRRYYETGPGINLYRRYRRVWNFSAYARAGVQREENEPLHALGVGRLSVERDLRDLWALRAAAAWSNSNVTGSGGFRRTTLSIEVEKRF